MTTIHQEEIQKILKMNKAGTISDEQAAELLSELSRSPRGRVAQEASGVEGLGDAISNLVYKTVDGAMSFMGVRGSMSHVEGFPPSEMEANQFSMSKVESPRQAGSTFRGNEVRMSHVDGLELESAEMLDNRIDASKVEGLRINGGKFSESVIQASSVEKVVIERSQLTQVKILSSKLDRLSAKDESGMENVKINASSLRSLTLGTHALWRDTVFSGVAIDGLETRDVRLTEVELQASHWRDARILGGEWSGVLARGLRLRDTAFVNCTLRDVLFSVGDAWEWKGWKKRGFDQVTFENCVLEKTLFSECRFANTVIKNVTLKDYQVRGADISGLTLDGNEAFLRAVERKG
jgi:uncharacterized protein YjbI with pentapeptide repeats